MSDKIKAILFATLMTAIMLVIASPVHTAPDPAARAAANVDAQWIVSASATTGTLTFSGVGTEIQLGGATQVAVEYEIASGTTAGVVVLEHSAVSGYTGTWANLDTQTVGSSFTTAPSKTVFTYPGPLGFIRARVTTTFSGGATPSVVVRVKRMFGQ